MSGGRSAGAAAPVPGVARAELLDGLFDSPVVYRASGLDRRLEEIDPAEQVLARKAIESRQREFATGRVLAHAALDALGAPDAPILRSEDRVPIWPNGFIGSISHCAALCAVAVAPVEALLGVGLDVEPDEPVSEGIDRVVCRGSEVEWVDAASDAVERGRRIKLVFSVKEATYKAFYPETRVFWSFQDVEVEIDDAAGRFRAALPESADVSEIEGRFARRSGWILSAVSRARRG